MGWSNKIGKKIRFFGYRIMNIPTWPVTLPERPEQPDYQESYTSLAQSVTTGNKSLLVRRNSTRAQDKLTVSFILDAEQVGYFTTFYYDTLAGGVLRFTFRHPRTEETIEVSFDPTANEAFTITPYNESTFYKLSASLIIWS